MTTDEYVVEVSLGPRAVDFVRSELECGHALAKAVLSGLPMHSWVASTFVPRGVLWTNWRTSGAVAS